MGRDQVRFDGRSILVTGAGRGLGRAHALLLASRGASIVVADNGVAMDGEGATAGPAEEVVAEIVAAGGEAVACVADISTETGATAAVRSSLDAFGRIDGILHNASTAPNIATGDKLSTHDFETVMRVNVFAGMWMTRAAWPHMTARGYGRIVYVTSSAGLYGAEGSASYAAAKSAYYGLLFSLAPEAARAGILINIVSPTAYTRMTARLPPSPYTDWFARTMAPEKMSVAVAYMLSEDCTLSGQILYMGGGHISRVRVGETSGVTGLGELIEAVRDAMPDIMAATDFWFPDSLAERSARIGEQLGYRGGVEANTYSAHNIGKKDRT